MGIFERVTHGFKKSTPFMRTDVRILMVLVIWMASALLIGCNVAFWPTVGTAAEVTQTNASNNPLLTFSGSNSHITEQSYRLITGDKEWSQVWASHLGTTLDDAYCPTLKIDFQRCSVIAIFKGRMRNSRGIQIAPTSDTGDSLTIRFMTLGYQSKLNAAQDPLDTPFAFAVVPRTTKTIVVEEGVTNKRHPMAEWKEVARLKP